MSGNHGRRSEKLRNWLILATLCLGAGALILYSAIWIGASSDQTEFFDRLQKIVGILTPIAVLFGLWVAWQRAKASERVASIQARQAEIQAKQAEIQARNAELAEQGQVTDRFVKAVEMLADGRLEIRIGGIYSLEGVARDTPNDDVFGAVFEVLCSLVRSRRPAVEDARDVSEQESESGNSEAGNLVDGGSEAVSIEMDIQAALTVIGRRAGREVVSALDLRNSDLRGADLRNTNLSGAKLSGADLRNADFRDADLSGADLCRAYLYRTDLRGANLSNSKLKGAKLHNANLKDADLSGANLRAADFRSAYLVGADFYGADFNGAKLQKVNLYTADLCSADLHFARELTQKALDSAKGDELTKIPKALQRPDHWDD